MPIALPHPEGVPVVGLLVLTVLALLMCAEIVLRGSGSRWEYLGPAGLVPLGIGIRLGSLPLILAGCAVMAIGIGLANRLRWRGPRKPDVRHLLDRRR
ncbi:hypothetical protein HUT16_33890 [Kitasatospora sp. NA04385]|uniref:hypothetical protein n=1 Tax=Kitasatospora sp. NA04385 TaxID=2742135 RepID=UPI001591DE88|nr:hypothetical protein [Kitasatospora sp. NA04385]QKW23417.1 hypothetical protein HUT16_33890 [Kitasatospora sp. NA04385]